MCSLGKVCVFVSECMCGCYMCFDEVGFMMQCTYTHVHITYFTICCVIDNDDDGGGCGGAVMVG